MAVLALDLGTRTGFAVGGDGAIICGTQDFTPSRYDSSAMRFVKFTGWLDQIHAARPIRHIVYEEVRRHAGVNAAHVYGGFMAHLLAWAETHGPIPAEAYAVGTIKKFWTGKGNAGKGEMIARAEAMGFEVPDDNAADALAMLHMALGLQGNEGVL